MRTHRRARRTIACLRRLSEGFFTHRHHPAEAPYSYKVPTRRHNLVTARQPSSKPALRAFALDCQRGVPYDIASLSLSCKQVCNLAKGLAKEAKECIPKYSTARFDHLPGSNQYTSSTYVFNFVGDLPRRPRIGLCITEFYVSGFHRTSSPNFNIDIQGLRKALSSIIGSSPYLNSSKSELWLDTPKESGLNPAIAFFLLFLPYVLRLTLLDLTPPPA